MKQGIKCQAANADQSRPAPMIRRGMANGQSEQAESMRLVACFAKAVGYLLLVQRKLVISSPIVLSFWITSSTT